MAFGRCQPVCTCGVVPCPHEKMLLCATCGDIKKTLCRKGPCVAAREPPRLTMREEAAPEPAPAAAAALEAAPEPEPSPMVAEAPEGFVPLACARPRRGT